MYPYTDRCPECVNTLNQPTRTEPINDGAGVLAHYRCECGHTWTCAWQTDPDALPPLADQRAAETTAAGE